MPNQLVTLLILIVLALSQASIKTTNIIRKQSKDESQTKKLFNYINTGSYEDQEELTSTNQFTLNPTEQPSEAPTIEPSEMPTEMPTEAPSEIDEDELELHAYFRLSHVPCASTSLSLDCSSSFFQALSDAIDLPISQLEFENVSEVSGDEIVVNTYIDIPLEDFPEFHGNTTKLSVYFMSIIYNAISEGTLSFLFRGYARHNLETCFYKSSVSQVSFNQPIVLPTTITSHPTIAPTRSPTLQPSRMPTIFSTIRPTNAVTSSPTVAPTHFPSTRPTFVASSKPTVGPSIKPTIAQSARPTTVPSMKPSASPSSCYLIQFKASMTIVGYPYNNLTVSAEETLLQAMGNIQDTGYSNFRIVGVTSSSPSARRLLETASGSLKVVMNLVFTMDDFPNFNGDYNQLFQNTSRRLTDSVASKQLDKVIKVLSDENNVPDLANATFAAVEITDFQSFQPVTPNQDHSASNNYQNTKLTIIISSVLGFTFIVMVIGAVYYFQRIYGNNDEKINKRLTITNKFEKRGTAGNYALPLKVNAEESILGDDADVESQFEGLFSYNQVYLWKPEISEDAVIINLAEDDSSIAKRKLDHPKFSIKRYDLVVEEFQCLESMV